MKARQRGTVYQRKGSPFWWVSFWKGEERVTKVARDATGAKILAPRRKNGTAGLKEAQEFLEAVRGDSRRGMNPHADRVVLADLERLVLANLAAREKASGKRAARAYVHLKHHFGDTPVLEVAALLDEYITARRRIAKPATVKQELAWLSLGYTLAVQKRLLSYRPMLPAISVRNARKGFVTQEQLEHLLAELPEYLRTPAQYAYLTGWRREEILGLRWSSVDLENGTARVEESESKNGEAREFPFRAMPDLEALILAQREATSAWEREHATICPWVFHRDGKRIKGSYDAWRSACERAGVAGVLLHDMRRSAVRNMERAGVPRSVAMKLSGHKTEAMYRRYAITNQADLEAGVAKVAALMASRAKRTG